MEMFGYIETNLFCIAVLVVMLVALRTSLSRLTNQTILTHVFVMIILMLVMDIAKIAQNGVVFAGSEVTTCIMVSVFHVVNVLLYFQSCGYNPYVAASYHLSDSETHLC